MQETLEELVDKERVKVLARTMLELKKEKAGFLSHAKRIDKQIEDVSKEMMELIGNSTIDISGHGFQHEPDIKWAYIGETGMAGHWRDPWIKPTVMLSKKNPNMKKKKGLNPKKKGD